MSLLSVQRCSAQRLQRDANQLLPPAGTAHATGMVPTQAEKFIRNQALAHTEHVQAAIEKIANLIPPHIFQVTKVADVTQKIFGPMVGLQLFNIGATCS